MNPEDIRPKLQRPTIDEVKRLGGWLAAHVLGGLFPLWGSLILVKLFSAETQVYDYIRQGEFALYAAAIAGSGLYLVLRDMPAPFPFRTILGIGLMGILVIATLLFAGVFVATRLTNQPEVLPPLDLNTLLIISVPLYCLALLITLSTTLIDMLRVTYDPRGVQKERMDKLLSDFHAVEDNSNGD